MEEVEINGNVKKSKYADIVTAQLICVLIIILGLLTVKYFFPDTFTEIKEFYTERICDETSIDEVIKKDGDTYEI